jgi:hypothetical protein
MTKNELVEMLERRDIVTTDPARADECCGLPRDEDGFCTYREGHPVYVARDQQPVAPKRTHLLGDLTTAIHAADWRLDGPGAERIAREVYNLLSDKGLLPEVSW